MHCPDGTTPNAIHTACRLCTSVQYNAVGINGKCSHYCGADEEVNDPNNPTGCVPKRWLHLSRSNWVFIASIVACLSAVIGAVHVGYQLLKCCKDVYKDGRQVFLLKKFNQSFSSNQCLTTALPAYYQAVDEGEPVSPEQRKERETAKESLQKLAEKREKEVEVLTSQLGYANDQLRKAEWENHQLKEENRKLKEGQDKIEKRQNCLTKCFENRLDDDTLRLADADSLAPRPRESTQCLKYPTQLESRVIIDSPAFTLHYSILHRT